MSESVDERVSELVGIAHDVEGEAVDEETLEAASEANELVRETDPGRLLEALDLTGTDGDGPATLPEAIATAESEAVEDLHALLEFAKLADDDGERTGERERAEEGDETVEGAEGQDGTESGADSSEDSEDDLQTQLRESMQSAFDDFGEDITGLRDHLEELTDDEEDDDVEDDEEKADDPRADDERRTDEDGEGDGDTSEVPSQNSARLSTMAPPPSDRADMRAVSRHSTMPDRRSRR
ncbi:hypothetical protein ACYJ1Y_14685 [Natrialbaceae archaeon A-gly3]